MSRRTILTAIAAIIVLTYIFIVVPLTLSAERNDPFKTLSIKIDDNKNTNFLKEEDIREIISKSYAGIDSIPRKNINTLTVEKILNNNSRVENARCFILNDGTLRIEIQPFDPVARVFDKKGSVYVNATGKRVPANPSYHVDVPVVTTEAIADSAMITNLLPLLRAVKETPTADALISSLRIDSRGDIIIIPNVVGHVINFGDTTLIQNKFDRLHTFYRDVMPIRGWDAFDTISVKWTGRVVATKRDKTVPQLLKLDNLENIVDETLEDDLMSPETAQLKG